MRNNIFHDLVITDNTFRFCIDDKYYRGDWEWDCCELIHYELEDDEEILAEYVNAAQTAEDVLVEKLEAYMNAECFYRRNDV